MLRWEAVTGHDIDRLLGFRRSDQAAALSFQLGPLGGLQGLLGYVRDQARKDGERQVNRLRALFRECFFFFFRFFSQAFIFKPDSFALFGFRFFQP